MFYFSPNKEHKAGQKLFVTFLVALFKISYGSQYSIFLLTELKKINALDIQKNVNKVSFGTNTKLRQLSNENKTKPLYFSFRNVFSQTYKSKFYI